MSPASGSKRSPEGHAVWHGMCLISMEAPGGSRGTPRSATSRPQCRTVSPNTPVSPGFRPGLVGFGVPGGGPK